MYPIEYTLPDIPRGKEMGETSNFCSVELCAVQDKFLGEILLIFTC
jgi:hypothetical protein